MADLFQHWRAVARNEGELRTETPLIPLPLPIRIPSCRTVWPRLRLGWDDQGVRQSPGNLSNDLRPDGFSELMALSNRDHEGSRPADHAVSIIAIKVLGVPGTDRALEHERKTIDRDAFP